MIKKKDFLEEYNIEKETLKKTGMKWEELNSIYDSYCRLEPQLKKIGKDFVNDYLYDIEKAGIHSYRYPNNFLFINTSSFKVTGFRRALSVYSG